MTIGMSRPTVTKIVAGPISRAAVESRPPRLSRAASETRASAVALIAVGRSSASQPHAPLLNSLSQKSFNSPVRLARNSRSGLTSSFSSSALKPMRS